MTLTFYSYLIKNLLLSFILPKFSELDYFDNILDDTERILQEKIDALMELKD